MWIGLNWFRIGSSNELLLQQWWIFWVHSTKHWILDVLNKIYIAQIIFCLFLILTPYSVCRNRKQFPWLLLWHKKQATMIFVFTLMDLISRELQRRYALHWVSHSKEITSTWLHAVFHCILKFSKLWRHMPLVYNKDEYWWANTEAKS
jgi:hypothetical protein